jgi:2-polyprenyl-3-methyl-5-hydroxy-6-metoxy-1,4-benzoquinol methylase
VSEGSSWAGLSLVCPRCRSRLAPAARGARCEACATLYAERDGILDLTLGRKGLPGYDPHYFEFYAEIDREHFWFGARRKIVREALRRLVDDLDRRRLFDIGCGSGGLLQFLAQEGVPVAGACDAYRESLDIVRGRVKVPLVLVDDGRLPPLGGGYSLFSLFDVLEHLDDDEGMLRFLFSVLEPGGVLVLTVPAHSFLFDQMDELAHHRRRYRRRELRQRLEAAGFEVRLLSHFMSVLVPPLIVMRAIGRALYGRQGAAERRVAEFRIIPVVNPVLGWILALERCLLRFVSLPFGSSIIAVAARPGDGRP